MSHPYESAPQRSFWTQAVATGWNTNQLVDAAAPLIRADDAVMTAGSCFAAAIVPILERLGIAYVRTEQRPAGFDTIENERFGYAIYSAAYGNIYTARQLLQLLQRATGRFVPIEDRWPSPDGGIIDPFRPGLRFAARNDTEFEILTTQHLARTLAAFRTCDVFVFTLGLTEAWVSAADGAVYPACPGTVAGAFDAARHLFKSFSVDEVVADLCVFVELLQLVNGTARVILSVSPVSMVATASGRHVVVANTLGKSILRVAADIVTNRFDHVRYFPGYELMTSPRADHDFFQEDRRRISAAGLDEVSRLLAAFCDAPGSGATRPAPVPSAALATQLSASIVRAECEEEMLDRPTSG